jgi:hypothetical protein
VACVSDASIEPFAVYSDAELAGLLSDLERGEEEPLQRLLPEIRIERARRREHPHPRSNPD